MATNLKNGGFPLSATDLIDSLNPRPATSTDPTMLSPSQLDSLRQGEPEIDEVLEEDEEVVPFQYAISTSGTDYAVTELVRRLYNGDIIVPTFQRGYVWSLREASRFIESLLLGLPVPNIFLSVEQDTQKRLVVDGRQRLSTLQYYYDGIWPLTRKEFSIRGTEGKYEGLTYKALADADRRRLDDAVLRASVIKQDQPSEDNSSIYHVFERLNTSGVSLTPQEIRAAIYHGDFSDLINNLNKNKLWREIYGPENRFMRDQELILRFFALFYNGLNYTAPMKGFLNSFMSWNRNLTRIPSETLNKLFDETISVFYNAIGPKAFRMARTINSAIFDSMMVGLAKRLASDKSISHEKLKEAYNNLLADNEYIIITQHSTGHPTNVERRLEMTTDAFAGVT